MSSIQIDESVISKRKENFGRMVKETWLLVMFDVTKKFGIIVYIENRTAQTTRNNIQKRKTRNSDMNGLLEWVP